jgi:O-antigen ligase
VWRLHDQVPAIGALSPALLATVLGMGVYVMDRDPRRAVTRLRSPILPYVIALPVLFVLTVPTSLWPTRSVEFLYQDYGMTLVFAALTALAIRSRRDVEWFALLHVVGATLYSAFVLLRGTVRADGRIAGLRYYDANDLGFVLVITLPFAVYFLRREARPWMRWAATLALAILSLTVVKTGSRGAFLGFVVVTGYILFHFTAIRRRTRIFAAVAGVAVMAVVGSEAYWTRIQTLLRPQEDYNYSDNNLAGRKAVWKRGLGYMVRRPLLGVGVRNYSQAEGMLSDVGTQRAAMGLGFKWSAAHNSFIELGAENGIPALIVFVSAIVVSIKTMRRLRPPRAPPGTPTSPDAALGQALIGALLGYCAAGFFLSQAYSAYLYSLFGMALGLSKLHPEAAAAPRRTAARTRSPTAPARGVA